MKERNKSLFSWLFHPPASSSLLLLLSSLLVLFFLCQNGVDAAKFKPIFKPVDEDVKNLTSYGASIDETEKLAYTDLQIVKSLVEIRKRHPEILPSDSKLYKSSKKYIQDALNGLPISEETEDREENWPESVMRNDSMEISYNPIAMFRLLYRMVHQLPRLTNITAIISSGQLNPESLSVWKDWVNSTNELLAKHKPPTKVDVQEVTDSIYRILSTYRISAYDLIEGNFTSEKITAVSDFKLDPAHCYEIGRYFVDMSNFANGMVFVSTAVKRSQKKSKLWRKGWKELWEAVGSHDGLFFTIGEEKEFVFRDVLLLEKGDEKHYEKIRTAYNLYHQDLLEQRRLKREKMVKTLRKDKDDLHEIFDELCAGHNLQTDAEKSKLFCYLERKRHPYYYLRPLKTEFLAQSPDIIQVYDLTGPIENKWIDDELRGNYERGRVFLSTDHGPVSSTVSHKVGMDAYPVRMKLSPPQHAYLMYGFARRGVKFTKYAPGGQFLTHDDSICKKGVCVYEGDRIAIFMTYITDVRAGGSTPFNIAGVAALPVTGSAVVWYNILSDGNADEETKHGGCPLILGQKLILTEQVNLYRQLLTHKCSLNRGERFTMLVNNQSSQNYHR